MFLENFSQIAAGVAKIAALVGLGVYGLFAVLVVRQVDLMAKTYTTRHEQTLKMLAYIHLGLVLLLVAVALVWL